MRFEEWKADLENCVSADGKSLHELGVSDSHLVEAFRSDQSPVEYSAWMPAKRSSDFVEPNYAWLRGLHWFFKVSAWVTWTAGTVTYLTSNQEVSQFTSGFDIAPKTTFYATYSGLCGIIIFGAAQMLVAHLIPVLVRFEQRSN